MAIIFLSLFGILMYYFVNTSNEEQKKLIQDIKLLFKPKKDN